jgi:O-antigen ligase
MTSNQNLNRCGKFFFYAFLLLLPLQARKVFPTDLTYYAGSFTEYGTYFLYLSDVLLAVSILCFLASKTSAFALLKDRSFGFRQPFFYRFLALLAWFFVSASTSSFLPVSLFRCLKLAEMIFLCLFLLRLFQDRAFLRTTLFMISFSGILQSLLAIYQFSYQYSAFSSPLLHKLTGEPLLSPTAPGIAKVYLDGEKILRAYGTFPHPNILGGFLLFTLFITLYLYLCHNGIVLSSLNRLKVRFASPAAFVFWFGTFALQLIALLLSFSRSAWIGLGLAAGTFLSLTLWRRLIVSRETSPKISATFRAYKSLIGALLFTLAFVCINFNLFSDRVFQDTSFGKSQSAVQILSNHTFSDRLLLNNVSRETFRAAPLTGSGPGTGIFNIETYLRKYALTDLPAWGFQPAHNIYLLMLSETGIVGLFIFLLLIIKLYDFSIRSIVSRETTLEAALLRATAISILTGFLFIGFFDHYFLTMQQGSLIFWISVAILIA